MTTEEDDDERFDLAMFDGLEPTILHLKLSTGGPLDIYSPEFGVGDRIRLAGVYECIEIKYDYDRKGRLRKTQVVRPVALGLVPFTAGADEGLKLRKRELT